MTVEQLEPFLSTDSSVFLAGEEALANLGQEALPILESFFSGKACNRWGVPIRNYYHAMRCVFATVFLLGPIAKPLEPWIRAELKNGDPMCADALAALKTLEPESVEALAFCVRQPRDDIAWQAASALIKCGYGSHPAFQDAVASLAENKAHGARRLERYIERSMSG